MNQYDERKHIMIFATIDSRNSIMTDAPLLSFEGRAGAYPMVAKLADGVTVDGYSSRTGRPHVSLDGVSSSWSPTELLALELATPVGAEWESADASGLTLRDYVKQLVAEHAEHAGR
jgi:hypothetical protein